MVAQFPGCSWRVVAAAQVLVSVAEACSAAGTPVNERPDGAGIAGFGVVFVVVVVPERRVLAGTQSRQLAVAHRMSEATVDVVDVVG